MTKATRKTEAGRGDTGKKPARTARTSKAPAKAGESGGTGTVAAPTAPEAAPQTAPQTAPEVSPGVADEQVVRADPARVDAAETAVPVNGRLAVRKTYKLFIGGAFPRSESGRSYLVSSSTGDFLANASRASRKDARDAVVAARKAFPGWSAATPYNRGQILYRVAEMLEGRRAQFAAEVAAADGVSVERAGEFVDLAVDRLVWYAGWSDKIAAVCGSANPVAGPYFNLSTPEPTGVVAVVAPGRAPLLGLVSVVAPVIVTGNTCVVVASERAPLPAITLSEVLATSDLPGGVVNVLTGRQRELVPGLAAHMDVNAIDLTGVDDPELAVECERAAAENLKRVLRPGPVDWLADPGLTRMTAFLETKTVWHPVGV